MEKGWNISEVISGTLSSATTDGRLNQAQIAISGIHDVIMSV
jgi:hypothetical protein